MNRRQFLNILGIHGLLLVSPTRALSQIIHHGFFRAPQKPSSISFITSASATSGSSTITIPASAQVGDLAILCDFTISASSIGSATPSGWNVIIDDGGAASGWYTRAHMVYRIIQTGDPGSSVSGLSAEYNEEKIMLVFRANSKINSVHFGSVNNERTGNNPSPQTVTTTGVETPLVVLGFYGCGSSGSISPRTFTPAADGEISSSGQGYVKYKIYNSSPADHSVDMDDEGVQQMQSCFIRVA